MIPKPGRHFLNKIQRGRIQENSASTTTRSAPWSSTTGPVTYGNWKTQWNTA